MIMQRFLKGWQRHIGVVGFIFYKFDVPTAPFILASILGGMMESSYINSMVYSKGSPIIFLQRPISLVLVIVSAVFLIWPWIGPLLRKNKQHKKVTA